MAINLSWSGPTLRTPKNNHGPTWSEWLSCTPRLILSLADFQHTMFQGSGHSLVHALWITAFDEIRCVPIANEQRLQFFVTDTGQDGGVIDLVTVEVQNGQHSPVRNWVEELVTVPASGERTGLRLTVAYHYEGYQIGVVVN